MNADDLLLFFLFSDGFRFIYANAESYDDCHAIYSNGMEKVNAFGLV